eukprot:scaffold1290_cov112-Skeletonema_dohrnii-CCMP3373.AAC.16
MDLDEDLEEIDLEEASSDEHVRYLRKKQTLAVPRRPNNLKKRASRKRAPKGWHKAKNSSRNYKGFLLHTWCHCMADKWFCFCLDL